MICLLFLFLQLLPHPHNSIKTRPLDIQLRYALIYLVTSIQILMVFFLYILFQYVSHFALSLVGMVACCLDIAYSAWIVGACTGSFGQKVPDWCQTNFEGIYGSVCFNLAVGFIMLIITLPLVIIYCLFMKKLNSC